MVGSDLKSLYVLGVHCQRYSVVKLCYHQGTQVVGIGLRLVLPRACYNFCS